VKGPSIRHRSDRKPMYSMHHVPLSVRGPMVGPAYVEDRLIEVEAPLWASASGKLSYPSSLQYGLLAAVRNPAVSDEARDVLTAMLLRLNPHPVVAQRWPMVSPAVAERAEAHARSAAEELRAATASALLIASMRSSPDCSFELTLQRELNDAVTEDFLGPGWRRKATNGGESVGDPTEETVLATASESPEDDLLREEAQEEARRLLLALRNELSPRQRELLDAWATGTSPKEWARAQGLEPSTVRVMLHDIRARASNLRHRKGFGST